MKQISSSLASVLKKDSVVERDYIIFSGEEIRHYIWFKLYDDCYKDGNFIGTFIMKRLEFTYQDSDLEFKKKEFNAYKEYKLDDGTWESIDYGTFIVQSVEPSDTKEEVKVTAYDYGLKFAKNYVSELDYSSGEITLLQVLQEACTKCEVELATTDFANSGFIVDSNQFGSNSLFGNVVSAVAGISCNFGKIKADNKLHLNFKNETGIIINTKDYEELEDKRDTLPYNAVSLGMSDIEGENVTIVAEGVEPEKAKFLTINDNPFAYTEDKRRQLIQAIFDKVNGFAYSSVVISNCLFPQLECGDLIQVRNKEGQLIDSIVLRPSFEEVIINIEAPSIIESTVKYVNPLSAYDIAKRTEYIVNKQEQTITSIVESTNKVINDVSDNTTQINTLKTQMQQDKESFEFSISNLTTTVNENNNNLQSSIDNINNSLANGLETLKNTLVTIDINGIKVSTNTSAIQTLMENNKFVIQNQYGTYLAYIGYDEEQGKTVAEMDNLTVTNYLTAGYHRQEKMPNGRTGWFYIG